MGDSEQHDEILRVLDSILNGMAHLSIGCVSAQYVPLAISRLVASWLLDHLRRYSSACVILEIILEAVSHRVTVVLSLI